MCGICGALDFRHSGSQSAGQAEETIRRMTTTLAHRGPDDRGVFVESPVLLGQTRLSIIDLSAAGHQPMLSDDGRVVLIYNGEIYNFPELRAELETAGHRFRSHCDTEVVLRGYLHWGEEVFPRLPPNTTRSSPTRPFEVRRLTRCTSVRAARFRRYWRRPEQRRVELD